MSSNTHIVSLDDGRQVCFSYGVPVAAYLPKAPTGPTYVKTDRKYSSTTSGHANRFCQGSTSVVPDSVLRKLILPLTGDTR